MARYLTVEDIAERLGVSTREALKLTEQMTRVRSGNVIRVWPDDLEHWLAGDSATWIYFIQAGASGPFKVGFAQNVAARLADLQTGNHEELSLFAKHPGSRALEGRIHFHLRDYRIRGEWFARHPDVVAYIDERGWRHRTAALRAERSAPEPRLDRFDYANAVEIAVP